MTSAEVQARLALAALNGEVHRYTCARCGRRYVYLKREVAGAGWLNNYGCPPCFKQSAMRDFKLELVAEWWRYSD